MPRYAPRCAQAVIEFALVLPLLMLVAAGTIEFGRGFYANSQLLQAVQEGARYGAVLGHAADTNGIVQRVQQAAPGGAGDRVTVQCSTLAAPTVGDRCIRGNLLTVTAYHRQAVVIPIFPLPALQQTAVATMLVE
jgi:Flp pilus assembly protein TadG